MTSNRDFVAGFVPQNLSAFEKAMIATRRGEAEAAKKAEREQRTAEARAEAVAEAARALGLEPGATIEAGLRLGEQEAVVGGLREQLAKEEQKLTRLREHVDGLQRMMAQATGAVDGRRMDVPGELAASRHAREVLADVQQRGWWQ